MSAVQLHLDGPMLDRLLSETEVAEAVDWLEQVAPQRWVIRGGLIDEGRIALDTLRIGCEGDVAVLRDCGWPQLVLTRIYVTEQPPECLVRALMAAPMAVALMPAATTTKASSE